MIFDITETGNGTSRLQFTHTKLNELACKEECHLGWAHFLKRSMRDYLEKGTGKPWRDAMPF